MKLPRKKRRVDQLMKIRNSERNNNLKKTIQRKGLQMERGERRT